MAKVLYRTCLNPKCKFKKNWVKATSCEQCGFDLVLNKMPKKRKEIVFDDVDVGDIKIPEVAQTMKACPECGHMVYHLSPDCDNCKYNFLTGKKFKKEDKAPIAQEEEKKEEAGV